jgi:hypothetical protein
LLIRHPLILSGTTGTGNASNSKAGTSRWHRIIERQIDDSGVGRRIAPAHLVIASGSPSHASSNSIQVLPDQIGDVVSTP